MKVILLALLASFSIQAVEIVKVRVFDKGESVFDRSKKYEVQFCSDEKCDQTFMPKIEQRNDPNVVDMIMHEVAKKVRRERYIQNYQIDGWNLYQITKEDLFKMLTTKRSEDEPYSQEEIENIDEYITKDQKNMTLYQFDLQTNYWGGTGLEDFGFAYNARSSWVTTFYRFVYGE